MLLPFLNFVNSAAINMGAEMTLDALNSFSLDIYSAMRLLDHMAVVCLFGFSFFETSS
jgi:hypothetical protein